MVRFVPAKAQENNSHFSSRKLEDAKRRIEKTMQWRREFKPDLIPPEEVSTWGDSQVGIVLIGNATGPNRK
jgi:hypothetical protein